MRITSSLLLLSTIALVFSGCGKEEAPPPTPDSTIDTLGPPRETDSVAPAVISTKVTIPDSLLPVNALADSLDQVVEQIQATTKAGLSGFRKFPSGFFLGDTNSVASHSIVFSFPGDVGCAEDTSYTTYYQNGNFTEGSLSGSTYYLAKNFSLMVSHDQENGDALGLGLQSGMTMAQVEAVLGKPYRRAPNLLIYGILEYMGETYREDVVLFFENGRLRYVRFSPQYVC